MSGVIAIYSKQNQHVVNDLYYGLYALQHRGQICCGVAVNNDGYIDYVKDVGLIHDVISKSDIQKLKGNIAIGHVQQSNKKEPRSKVNIDPLVIGYKSGSLAIAGDGKIVNEAKLKLNLLESGMIFQTNLDTETLAVLMAKYGKLDLNEAFQKMIEEISGAYAIIMITTECILAARDPHGIKPLTIGQIDQDIVVSSESCAIEVMGGEFIRDVRPGEIVRIDHNGVKTLFEKPKDRALCMFELVYLARPDSIIDEKSVYLTRVEVGKQLYLEYPDTKGDIVIGSPDSGIPAAIGYAQQSGIPYAEGLVKNRYIGRTFIEPSKAARENFVRIKLNVLKENVKGKRIILVDDSIVRGTTISHTIEALKQAGAKEVHIRVASPPVKYTCHLGVDMHLESQLVSRQMNEEELCKKINADSLQFISMEGMLKATDSKNGYCKGCFTSKYPIPQED